MLRLTDLGIGLGWEVVTEFLDVTGADSSSDDESLSTVTVEGPLLASLIYFRNGGASLLAIDLADLSKLTIRSINMTTLLARSFADILNFLEPVVARKQEKLYLRIV